jgi:hypothetical protein
MYVPVSNLLCSNSPRTLYEKATPTIQESVRASCCTYKIRFANKRESESKTVGSQTGQLQKKRMEERTRPQGRCENMLCTGYARRKEEMPLIYKVAPYMLQNVEIVKSCDAARHNQLVQIGRVMSLSCRSRERACGCCRPVNSSEHQWRLNKS